MQLENVGPIERLVGDREPSNHVYFDAEKGRLVATNGHALIAVECKPDAGDVSGLISVEAIKDWRELRRGNKIANMVAFRALATELIVEDIPSRIKRVHPRPHGGYHHYEQLLPKIEEGVAPSVTFNPHVLAALVAAFPPDDVMSKGRDAAASISMWLLPQHKRKGKAAKDEQVPPIMIKGLHGGALAIMTPVTGVADEGWQTTWPGTQGRFPVKAEKPEVVDPEKIVDPTGEVVPAQAQDPTQPTTQEDNGPSKAANEPPHKAPKAPRKASARGKKNGNQSVPPVHGPNGHDKSEVPQVA